MPSHYETLGVAETASDDEIKKAYRGKAKEFHPDLNPNDAVAAKKFQEVSDAYDVLKDKDKKAYYDHSRKPRSQSSHYSPGSDINWDEIFSQQGSQYNNQSKMNFEELLRAAQARSGQGQYERPRNKDTVLNYTVNIVEAYNGKTVTLRYNTGSTTKTAEITIPKSVQNGARIRYPGKGEDTDKNAAPGDLYVIVAIAPSTQFVRNGADVSTTVYIDFIDAMLGVNKRVECIDGSEINLRVHAGLNPGSHIKVPEKGFMSEFGKRGHMFVEIVMEQPKLNDKQYELLAKIKEL